MSIGMLLLGIWLILTGLVSFIAVPLSGPILGLLAVLAGLLILVGH